MILLSDLVFNHFQMRHPPFFPSTLRLPEQMNIYIYVRVSVSLLTAKSTARCLRRGSPPLAHGEWVLVLYTHHRLHLAQRDMRIFDRYSPGERVGSGSTPQ
jgi:predicted nicotinamide N-methyase